MNFNMQHGDSFFKILRMESEPEVVLPLPSAFAKKHFEKGQNETQPIILETISGEKWKVKYAKIKDEHYFVDDTRFKVAFYGPDGCLIQPASPCKTNTADTAINNEKQTSEDDSKNKNKKRSSVTKIIQKSYFTDGVLPLTRQLGEETGIGGHGHGCAKLKNKKGEWHVKVSMVKGGNLQQPRIVGTEWSKFLKDNKVKIGDSCKITHVKDDELHIRVIKKKKRLGVRS